MQYSPYSGNNIPLRPVTNNPAFVAGSYVPYVHVPSAYGTLHQSPITQPMTAGIFPLNYTQTSAPQAPQQAAYPAFNTASFFVPSTSGPPTVHTAVSTAALQPTPPTAAVSPQATQAGPSTNNKGTVAAQKEPQNYQQQELYNWLKAIGMDKYYYLFIKSGIDEMEKLRYVESTQDLAEIGIAPITDKKAIFLHLQNMRKADAMEVDAESRLLRLLDNQPLVETAKANESQCVAEQLLHHILQTGSCKSHELQSRFSIEHETVMKILSQWTASGYLKSRGNNKGFIVAKQYKGDMLKYASDPCLDRLKRMYGPFISDNANNCEKRKKRPHSEISRRAKDTNYNLRSSQSTKTAEQFMHEDDTDDEAQDDTDSELEPPMKKLKLSVSDYKDVSIAGREVKLSVGECAPIALIGAPSHKLHLDISECKDVTMLHKPEQIKKKLVLKLSNKTDNTK